MKIADRAFCAYIHARPNGMPFYIGKGSSDRAYNVSKHMGRNSYHANVVAKYGAHNIKVRIIHCRDERHAFAMEMKIIADLRTMGFLLTNMTDGGEGVSGRSPSEETKAKIGASNLGKKRSIEHLTKMSQTGRIRSPESCAKMSAAKVGKKMPPRSAETLAKMSVAAKLSWSNRKINSGNL